MVKSESTSKSQDLSVFTGNAFRLVCIGPDNKIVDFVGYTVPVRTAQFYCSGMRSVLYTQTNEHVCVPINFINGL